MDQGTKGSMITMMADPNSEVTQALGMELTDAGPVGVLGPKRCKRHAIFVDDGVIKAINVSEAPGDPAGDGDPSKTCVDHMLTVV